MKIMQQKMMTKVKEADVVVVNPTHFAVALMYKPDKVVQQLSFADDTLVAQNGLLTKIVNGQKISVEAQSMQKVVDSIAWA